MDLYRQEILEHYKNPHNFGKLTKYSVIIDEGNASCGDKITIYFYFKDKKLAKIAFKGEGCAISMAATSMLTDFIKGKKISQLNKIDEKDIYRLLGGRINPGRRRCATLSLNALKKALKKNQENIDEK